MSQRHHGSAPALIMAAGLFMIAGCGSTDSKNPGTDDPAVDPADPPTLLRTAADGTRIDHAAKNTYYLCPRAPVTPPLTKGSAPWVDGDSIVVSKIEYVEGSMSLTSQFDMTMTATDRVLKGNGIPNHPIGQFPIQKGTAAYDYYAALPADGYDNAAEIPVAPYDIDLTLPRDPKPNAKPTCVGSIFTGVVSQTGGAWHLDIAPDNQKRLYDPISALPIDECWGHPYMDQYHYHAYSWKCFPNQGNAGEHSPLFGYAIDGFGVFGPRGEDGKLVSNDDLDECHGHTHVIEWDGEMKEMYHYHQNNQFPYSIGCFRGTPIELPDHLQM